MRSMPFLIKNEHGTYYAQRKVPGGLAMEKAVARVLKNGRERQPYLKKSLGTSNRAQANISVKPVLIEFDRIIRAAEALVKSAPPIRKALAKAEIERMAEYVYGKTLAWDERWRVGGRDEAKRARALLEKEVAKEGRTLEPNAYAYDALPMHGLSREQLQDDREQLVDDLGGMQEALALGDVSAVEDHVAEALSVFGIELAPESPSRPQLGIAVLRAYVRALQAIEKRHAGEPVETPAYSSTPLSGTQDGTGTLLEAQAGWLKQHARSSKTQHEYKRAIELFTELHGNMPIAAIKRSHVRLFREALQNIPRKRAGALLRAPLPEVSEHGSKHPSLPKIKAATVNKQLGAVQAIVSWAEQNGLIPEDTSWSDPFRKMQAEVAEPSRTSFEFSELQTIFDAPLFTEHHLPEGARGAAGVWLPLLALFTGARQGELAGLMASNVEADASTGASLLFIVSSAKHGKVVKTLASLRVIPLHPELVRLGFLDYVAARRAEGSDAWLFPMVSPKERGGLSAWSKWYNRYMRATAVNDPDKVFHSFRHGFNDALRRVGAPTDLRKALLGHAQGDTNEGYGAKQMLARYSAEALVAAVSNVSYPGLDLSKVRTTDAAKPARRKRSSI